VRYLNVLSKKWWQKSALILVGVTVAFAAMVAILPSQTWHSVFPVVLIVFVVAFAGLLGTSILQKARGIAPTEVEISRGSLIVRVKGVHKVLALKSRVVVPLEHVVSTAPVVDEEIVWGPGFGSNTRIPRVMRAGSVFKKSGESAFIVVHDSKKAIMIRLRDEDYDLLVIEVRDPAAAVATIQEAIGQR
jgi:hypothetical protein